MVQSHYQVVPLEISSLLWVVCVCVCLRVSIDNRLGFLGFQCFNIFKCQNELPSCLFVFYLYV